MKICDELNVEIKNFIRAKKKLANSSSYAE